MSVTPVGAVGFTPYVAPTLPTPPAGPASANGVTGAGGDFGSMLLDGVDRLEGVQDKADQLAVQAATGDLTNIHDYTTAAAEAAVTTKLTVAVRNKAIEAFNEIMRMQV
jgi:flagellar hook-basal body complex protein FliE